MMCPNCRAWSEPSNTGYCLMCSAPMKVGDTSPPAVAPEAAAVALPPDVDLSQLQRYWEGDVAHWMRHGCDPSVLRALLETVIAKVQKAQASHDWTDIGGTAS